MTEFTFLPYLWVGHCLFPCLCALPLPFLPMLSPALGRPSLVCCHRIGLERIYDTGVIYQVIFLEFMHLFAFFPVCELDGRHTLAHPFLVLMHLSSFLPICELVGTHTLCFLA
jgi:hypothetical protein